MHVKRSAVPPEADAAIETGATETDLDANFDSSTDGEADILGLHPLATPSAGTSSKETKGSEHANKRRKQILARLGLKHGVGIRFGNFGGAGMGGPVGDSAGEGSSAVEDSEEFGFGDRRGGRGISRGRGDAGLTRRRGFGVGSNGGERRGVMTSSEEEGSEGGWAETST